MTDALPIGLALKPEDAIGEMLFRLPGVEARPLRHAGTCVRTGAG